MTTAAHALTRARQAARPRSTAPTRSRRSSGKVGVRPGVRAPARAARPRLHAREGRGDLRLAPARRSATWPVTLAKAKAAANVTTQQLGEVLPRQPVERSMILLLSVCGHMGRRARLQRLPVPHERRLRVVRVRQARGAPRQAPPSGRVPRKVMALKMRWLYRRDDHLRVARDWLREGRVVLAARSSGNVHGGLLELANESQEWDPHLKRAR